MHGGAALDSALSLVLPFWRACTCGVSRRGSSQRDESVETRVEPRLDQDDDWQQPDPLLGPPPDVDTASGETGLLFEDLPVPEPEAVEPPTEVPPEKILVVHIRAMREPGFPGPDLVAALELEGLVS